MSQVREREETPTLVETWRWLGVDLGADDEVGALNCMTPASILGPSGNSRRRVFDLVLLDRGSLPGAPHTEACVSNAGRHKRQQDLRYGSDEHASTGVHVESRRAFRPRRNPDRRARM